MPGTPPGLGGRGKAGRALVDANQLASVDKPILIVWAAEDKVPPVADGRRLAASIPEAPFVGSPTAGP